MALVTSSKIPEVGPSPTMPVQVEGIYTNNLLNSGTKVTLLYQDFKDKHLKHLSLWKLEDLETPLWLGTGILYVMSQHFRHHMSLCHWSHQEFPNSGDRY